MGARHRTCELLHRGPYTRSPMPDETVRVPGFRVLRELGRGASGVVYLAREEALGREVALKILKAGVAHSPEVRARFEREVRSAARVRHPNIVPVLATGEADGRLWYTMELVDGPSLDRVLAESGAGRLPPARAARVVLETARVLAAAHRAGVTHRDVKPANIVLLREAPSALESASGGRRLRDSWLRPERRERGESFVDRPRLTDFGLATDAEQARLSESGMLIGTPGYMAPEQFMGRSGEVGPASDQWALGVVLYECLTGRLPFSTDDIPTLARLVAEGEPVPPSRLDPRVDAELETLCLTCLEKDPRHRYPSCDALVADLERWLRDEPIAARPPGLVRRARAWARRRPRLVTALTALAVVLVVGAVVFLRWRWTNAEHLRTLAATARAAESRGAWDEAEQGYEAWVAAEPGSALARDGRERARAVLQVLGAERGYDAAQARIGRLAEAEVELESLRRAAARGAEAPGGRGLGLENARGSEPWWLREPAWTARAEVERRSAELVRERAAVETTLAVALATADAAGQAAGPEGARVRARIRSGAALWHLGAWRRAEKEGRADQAATHRMEVERLDPEPHRAELAGDATLVLVADAPGAEGWLFRYVREADVLPRGGAREIPLPWPVAGTTGDLPPAPPAYAALLRARFADEGTREAVPDVPAPASVYPDDPVLHVGTAEGPLRRERYAALKDAEAYPLVKTPANALGPLASERSLALPAGRYLLLVEAPGKIPLRRPVRLPRSGTVRLEPEPMRAPGEVPPGFVAVSGGPVGDVEVRPFLAARLEVTFAEYWEFLADRRTREEIARRLPEDEAARRPADWRYVPRDADGPLSRPAPGPLPDGRFEPVQNAERPVAFVSLYDLVGYPEPPLGETEPLDGQVADVAQALAESRTVGWGYLAWRTERSRANVRLAAQSGAPALDVVRHRRPDGTIEARALRFTLPTEEEWARMAGAGDGRAFVFGDEPDWGYFKGAFSRRTNPVPEPVGLFPDDESVFGVRDLTGSAEEWTSTWDGSRGAFVVRGGSWATEVPADGGLAARLFVRPQAAPARVGFRVIVRAEPESVR
jgi:formylglycine-generating enzyme required for sulfatase activity/predicted Ser/Thr protein kinase